MIEKFTFVSLMEAYEKFHGGERKLEEVLQCQFDDNFMTNVENDIIDVLALSFFTDEDREYAETNAPSWLHQREEDNLLVTIDTVYDMIFHFMFNANFGKNERLSKDFMKVTHKDGSVVTYNCYDAELLYQAIMTYLNRTDELEIVIRCSSIVD